MILRTAVVFAMIFSFSFYLAEIKEKKIENKNLLQAEVGIKIEIKEKTLKEIATSFLNTPYKRNPLGEGEDDYLYRTDVFDCTTFVLSVIAEKHAKKKNAEEIMLEINYHPPGTVSYNNRNHFTTYRNSVSSYFEDVTRNIGENFTNKKTITLNKKIDGKRVINIDWEKEIVVFYILKKDIEKIINNIGEEIGVGFININQFNNGLDIVHEGLLFDRKNLFHASSKEKRVIQEDFLNYLKQSNHDGVLFYKIN